MEEALKGKPTKNACLTKKIGKLHRDFLNKLISVFMHINTVYLLLYSLFIIFNAML